MEDLFSVGARSRAAALEFMQDDRVDLLPKLLYALDSGMVNDLVCDLLRDKNLYGLFRFNTVLAEAVWKRR